MSEHLISADGALALFDPKKYQSFVAEDWTPPQLQAHFVRQMRERRLLIWGTGAPGDWKIEVAHKGSDEKGYREVNGSITATGNRLYFIDYETLTKLAEFPHEKVALEELEDMAVLLAPGTYDCRIVQLYDPKKAETEEVARQPGTHFLVELESTLDPLPARTEVPWLET